MHFPGRKALYIDSNFTEFCSQCAGGRQHISLGPGDGFTPMEPYDVTGPQ